MRRRNVLALGHRMLVGIASGCLAFGLAAAPAAAAPAWLSPVAISAPATPTSFPQVAFDPQGDAVAVWEQRKGTEYVIQAASRPAGGSWQSPVNLSAAGKFVRFPEVALDSQGNAVVAWEREISAKMVVEAAIKPAGGSWQPPVGLSAAGHNAYLPQVAVDPQGNAVVVWEDNYGGGFTIQAASRPAAGSWQPPAGLSAAGQNARLAEVAIDAQGNALAIWERGNTGNWTVQVASRPAGGSWQTPTNLSSAVPNEEMLPQVAVDPQGDAVVVWLRESGTSWSVQAASRPAGGSWQAPVNISTAASKAEYPQVAIDAQGNATATWGRESGTSWVVQAASRPAGGSWQPPVNLTAVGVSAGGAGISVDPQGDAVAVWQGWNKFNWEIQAASRPAGGSWQAPVDLSEKGKNAWFPEVAIDPQGNALAIWMLEAGGVGTVQGAGYDAAGPQLRSLSIPVKGDVGQPIPFSVSPLDVWSPLGASSWSFGDGGSVGGTSATHKYARSGSYRVTLTSADTLGNATSTTGMIEIRPCASAARLARVKAGNALLKLKNHAAAPCRGIAKLSVRKGHKQLPIGRSAFKIRAKRTKLARIKLTARGNALVRRAGSRGLRGTLSGLGVKGRTVLLKP